MAFNWERSVQAEEKTMLPPICPGPNKRREFLRLGILALGGATLSDLLAARAAARQHAPDTSVILFWMWGGPSQIETWRIVSRWCGRCTTKCRPTTTAPSRC